MDLSKILQFCMGSSPSFIAKHDINRHLKFQILNSRADSNKGDYWI
jgi:hypothetical protein